MFKFKSNFIAPNTIKFYTYIKKRSSIIIRNTPIETQEGYVHMKFNLFLYLITCKLSLIFLKLITLYDDKMYINRYFGYFYFCPWSVLDIVFIYITSS